MQCLLKVSYLCVSLSIEQLIIEGYFVAVVVQMSGIHTLLASGKKAPTLREMATSRPTVTSTIVRNILRLDISIHLMKTKTSFLHGDGRRVPTNVGQVWEWNILDHRVLKWNTSGRRVQMRSDLVRHRRH